MSQMSSRKKLTAVWFIVHKLWQDNANTTEPLHQCMFRNTNKSRVLVSVCFRFNYYIHTYIHTCIEIYIPWIH
jgi:hypothetical protein